MNNKFLLVYLSLQLLMLRTTAQWNLVQSIHSGGLTYNSSLDGQHLLADNSDVIHELSADSGNTWKVMFSLFAHNNELFWNNNIITTYSDTPFINQSNKISINYNMSDTAVLLSDYFHVHYPGSFIGGITVLDSAFFVMLTPAGNGGYPGGIYVSYDTCRTFTLLPNSVPDTIGVLLTGAHKLYGMRNAASGAEIIYSSADYGVTWDSILSVPNDIFTPVIKGDTIIYQSMYGNSQNDTSSWLIHSFDGGVTYDSVLCQGMRLHSQFLITDTGLYFIYTSKDVMHYSTDFGATFVNIGDSIGPTTTNTYNQIISAFGRLWLSEDSGCFYQDVNSNTWRQPLNNIALSSPGAWSAKGETILAMASNYSDLYWSKGGADNFKHGTIAIHTGLFNPVVCVANDSTFLVLNLNNDSIYRGDTTLNFQTLPPSPENFHTIISSGSNLVGIIAGSPLHIYISNNFGQSWTKTFSGDTLHDYVGNLYPGLAYAQAKAYGDTFYVAYSTSSGGLDYPGILVFDSSGKYLYSVFAPDITDVVPFAVTDTSIVVLNIGFDLAVWSCSKIPADSFKLIGHAPSVDYLNYGLECHKGVLYGCFDIGVYASVDNGRTWFPFNDRIQNGAINSVVFTDSLIYASGNGREAFGGTWVRNVDQLHPIYYDTSAISICQGDTFGGHTLSGIYSDTIISVNSDTIVALTLTVNNRISDSTSVSICRGSSYPFGSSNLTSTGIYRQTLTGANGCDSIITLLLTVDSTPAISWNGSTDTANVNSTALVLTGGNPAGGEYSGPGVWNGTFYPDSVGPGNYILSYTYTDSLGCSDSATKIFTVVVSGIHELELSNSLFLSPNPATDELNIQSDQISLSANKVAIYDVDGRLLTVPLQVYANKVVFNISALAGGVYWVKVKTSSGALGKKFVKV